MSSRQYRCGGEADKLRLGARVEAVSGNNNRSALQHMLLRVGLCLSTCKNSSVGSRGMTWLPLFVTAFSQIGQSPSLRGR